MTPKLPATSAKELGNYEGILARHSSQYPPTSVRDTVTFILKSRAIWRVAQR